MRSRFLTLILALLAGSISSSVFGSTLELTDIESAGRPFISIHAAVGGTNSQDLTKISGQLTIQHWQTPGQSPGQSLVSRERCFVLPYNDPEYGDDRGARGRIDLLGSAGRSLRFSGGETLVEVATPARVVLTTAPFLLRLILPEGFSSDDLITLTFESTLPRQPGESTSDFMYEGWYPQPLASCPQAGSEAQLDALYFRQGVTADIKARINYPADWTFVGPSTPPPPPGVPVPGQADMNLTAHNLAFVLGRDYRREQFIAAGVPVQIFYHSDSFRELKPTIEASLGIQSQLLGDFPFPSLNVVETTELQKYGLPGLIAVNRPRQGLFGRLQADWINWSHWMSVALSASQWYGGAIRASSPDDKWLIDGTVDFLTYETLKHLPARFDLFNPMHDDWRLLSFDYLQMANITAASLRRSAPFITVTDTNYLSIAKARQQNSLLYIRHATALRQLSATMKTEDFNVILRGITAQKLRLTLTPREFRHLLNSSNNRLGLLLDAWWIGEGWPDFALEDFSVTHTEDGRWRSDISAKQEGELDFPPLLSIRRGEKTAAARAVKGDDNAWHAQIISDFKPNEAEVDRSNEAFDSNRFNNKSSWPNLYLFPGSANTLKDDGYTLLWLPYAFRRPGEPFSLGLQGGLFRYIQGGAIFRVEYAPSTKAGAYEIRQRILASRYALQTDLSLEQTYESDRQVEFALTRTPLFGGEPFLSIALKSRHKQRMGEPDSQHSTIGAGISVKPAVTPSICTYNLTGEAEEAPKQLAKNFSYQRRFASAFGNCTYEGKVDLGLRIFTGFVDTDGPVPEAALFKLNDLREAKLRLDRSGLPRVRRLVSMNNDLFIPFLAPVPADSLILARKVRWRMFYDYGKALEEKQVFRSSGLGFFLPIGGDLSGAGSLTMTQITALAVLYQSINGEVSRKPSFIFDVTGDL